MTHVLRRYNSKIVFFLTKPISIKPKVPNNGVVSIEAVVGIGEDPLLHLLLLCGCHLLVLGEVKVHLMDVEHVQLLLIE